MLAVESGHLHLPERIIVSRAGVDLDTRQQRSEREILQGSPPARRPALVGGTYRRSGPDRGANPEGLVTDFFGGKDFTFKDRNSYA